MFDMEGTAGRARAAALAAVVAASSLIAAAVPAAARPSAPRPATQAPPPAVVDPLTAPGIDPVLDEVEVDDTAATRRADDRYADAQRAEDRATDAFVAADGARLDLITRSAAAGQAVVEAEAAVAAAEAELDRQEAEQDRRDAVTTKARTRLTVEQDGLRSVVSAVFTSKPADSFQGMGTFDQLTVEQRRQDVRDRAVDVQVRVVEERDRIWRTARGASAAQARRVDRTADERDARVDDLGEARDLRDDLGDLLAAAEQTTADRRADLDAAGLVRLEARRARREARMAAPVSGTDLTLVALHAYWRAAAIAPCTTPWWLLAGVGKVETRHGTFGGSTVQPDGLVDPAILGIPLDGRPGVAAIRDTDGGRLDRDGTWDRAVGPMQFIPGTWARWGRDGNGDGVVDPHNLYDAAEAAATYLCFGRASLLDDGSRRAALLSYNQSVPYGTRVLSEGRSYLAALDLPEVPPAEAATATGEPGG